MVGKKAINFKAQTKARNAQRTKLKKRVKRKDSRGTVSKDSDSQVQAHTTDSNDDSDEAEASDASDLSVDEEDVQFFANNAGGLKFLSNVNPNKLEKVKKEKKKKIFTGKRKKEVAAPGELTESEDEENPLDYESGSDLEVLDSDNSEDSGEDQLVDFELSDSDSDIIAPESNDNEDDLEVDTDEGTHNSVEPELEYRNSKQRRALKRKAANDALMGYEQEARNFEQTKKNKLSTKLPIKLPDGKLAIADADVDEGEESEENEESEADEDSSDAESQASDESQGSYGSGEDDELAYEEDPETGEVLQRASAGAGGRNTGGNSMRDLSEAPNREEMPRKQYIITQQNRISSLADIVIQNPESGSKALRILRDISEDDDKKVKQLAMLTLLAVYRDILPDYRIRDLSEKERQMKVSKEVQQHRLFEESLVRNYGRYLQQLFKATKAAMKVFGDESADVETGIVATRALGELINAHPHFNYRKDILSALVDIYVQPPSRINFAAFTPMANIARLAILRLFRNDPSGEYSQNAVILASKRIKRLSYRIDPSALRPWLHLRLREELRENPEDKKRAEIEQARKEKQRERQKLLKKRKGGAALKSARRGAHESKKQKMARQVQEEVDRSLRDAEAEVSREERGRWYGETLKQVFITYFRILKQKDNIGSLLPAVLEGLAKYAHLISVEFFVDLFHLLKKIMCGQHGVGIGAEEASVIGIDDGDDVVSSRVSLRTSLLCILAALHILTGQGEALNLDLKDFFYQLYALLPPLAAHPQIESTRLSAHSDGTRYTVYLTPAEVATSNAERFGQKKDIQTKSDDDVFSNQLDEAMWEETVLSESDLLFECLELMFLGRTKVSSITRVASFAKRLAEAAMYWPPKTSVKAIEFINKLLIKYPQIERLFSSEDQTGNGLYLRDLDDPDMCNPYSTCLYELHWLQTHHNAGVREATARLFKAARSEARKSRL